MASDLSLDEYVAREERYERTGKLDPAPSAAGPIPPPPIPGQLPTPPGTSGFGPIGQTVYDAFQPEPPGTDPFSVHPADLWRQLRQGILSDDDIAEIKRNPKSPRSVAALAQGAIMLSRGAGEGENLNWRIIPKAEWDGMTTPKGAHPTVKVDDAGNAYQATGTHEVKNPDGTSTGHVIANALPPRTAQDVLDDLKSGKIGPPQGDIGKAVPYSKALEDKFGPEPGSPEWFKAKSDAFQKKNFPGAQDLGATGSNPVQKWDELAPEVQRWFKDQYGHDSDASAEKHWNDTLPDTAKENKSQMSLEDQVDAWKHFVFEEKGSPENMPPEVKKAIMDQADTPEQFAKLHQALHPETGPESPDEGPATPKELQDMKAYMDSLKNKPKMQPEENFPNWNESHGVKEAKFDDAGHVDTLREYATRNNLSAEEYHKLLDASLAPKEPPTPDLKGSLEDFNKQFPPEEVGPVDWNWYKPQGGSNPPFEPPFQDSSFQVPHGWDIAPEDMGPRSSDFWDRFGWKPPADSPGISDQELNDLLKPPPDPNSPDFPGFNRWDFQPPPD